MQKIVILHRDNYFSEGLQSVLEKLYPGEVVINRYTDLSELPAEDIDLAFIQLTKSEARLCHPELCQLSKRCQIYAFIEGSDSPLSRGWPEWIHQVVLIDPHLPVSDVCGLIMHSDNKKWRQQSSCQSCKHQQLTERQLVIACGLWYGTPVKTIARENALSEKTVFAHKRLIMRKFRLHSDLELFVFLQQLKNRTYNPNPFRDMLESK